MIANRWVFTLLLSAAVFQLVVQQTRAEQRSIEELKAKAGSGDAESESALGGRYLLGDGVAKDKATAVKWYRKAAEQGHANAQTLLGMCLFDGDGVAKDQVEAVKWLRKGAEQGNFGAQTKLAYAYDSGLSVPKDSAKAVELLRKAVAHDFWVAEYNLGCHYRDGEGVAKDEVEAVKWFRKAAEQNCANAQYDLGISYVKGNGVPKDEVEAYKWWLLAAAQGVENAKKNMAVSERRLTREQIAEGQKLARDFKPREVPSDGADRSATEGDSLRPHSSGTGFFITEDGYLVTNEHVAGGNARVRLVTAAGSIPARVVKVNAANDLALLKVEGKFAALPVATSRSVRLGSTVATVGFPNIGMQGFAPKLARGEIGSLSGPQDDARYFQISVPQPRFRRGVGGFFFCGFVCFFCWVRSGWGGGGRRPRRLVFRGRMFIGFIFFFLVCFTERNPKKYKKGEGGGFLFFFFFCGAGGAGVVFFFFMFTVGCLL